MRSRALLAAALWLLPAAHSAVLAADVRSTSELTAVTVFPRGAEVTRTARVRLTQGEHAVVLDDLPAQTVAASIRVEGRSTGRLEIGSVDSRRIKVPRTDPVASESERRRLEIAIEKLKDERALVDADVKAAELQKVLVTKLAELPTRPAPANSTSGTPAPDWGALFALIGSRLAEAEKAVLAAGLRGRAIDRRIVDMEKALESVAPVVDERTEIRVNVTAPASLEATLVIRYQVPNASWTPLYDARLATGQRNVAPTLTLVRRASIQQRTGEEWRDVALTLSTTRPSGGSSVPQLSPMAVDFEPEAPPPRPVASAPPGQGYARERESAPRRSSPMAAGAPAMKDVTIDEQSARVEVAPFQALYALPGKTTVPTTGEAKRVQIDTAQAEPSLVVVAVPRLQKQAYLYAKLVMPKTTAFLPGTVALFRDGTFVGNGQLPLLSPGQGHELGFGTDDSIQVKHAVVEEKRGETGIISASRTDTRAYRITIKNLHERPIALSVLDQMPTSRQQDIKVELTGRTPPTRRDVDERRGVLAWDGNLQPNEERIIEFGYRVSWPAAKRVIYGR